MGYCMSMQDCKFLIKQEMTPELFSKLKNFLSTNKLMWVDSRYLEDANNIEDLFDEIRYDIRRDLDNNIVSIDFFGEKLGDDLRIFQEMAEFVEDGSYIEMSGEDNCMWRWCFKGGECKEIEPKIVWESQ